MNPNRIYGGSICRLPVWMAVLMLVWVVASFPQERSEGRGVSRRGRGAGMLAGAFLETVVIPGDSAGIGRVDVIYRIPSGYFVFVADQTDPAGERYTAGMELNLEVIDSAGNSAAHAFVTKSFEREKPSGADDADAGHEPASEGRFAPEGGRRMGGGSGQRELYPGADDMRGSFTMAGSRNLVQGIASFALPSGKYSLIVDVKDRESPRRYFDDKHAFAIPSGRTPVGFSDLLFTEVNDHSLDTPRVIPLNFGGDIPFGLNFDAFLDLRTSVPAESVTVSYTLAREGGGSSERKLAASRVIKGSYRLDPVADTLLYAFSPSQRPGHVGAWLYIQGDTLEEGNYTLSIHVRAPGVGDSTVRKFAVKWFNAPRSLRIPELRRHVMGYIVSDSTASAIKSMHDDAFSGWFENFWKSKDPSPHTTMNEAEAEYFDRVDRAVQSYSSSAGFDGYKTDRGKTSIVYGPPDRTERLLSPSSYPQEVWFYPGLNKKFIFIDQTRKGDYTLLEMEPDH